MPRYRIFDRVLRSAIELPELPETTGAADYRFDLDDRDAGQADSRRHVHDWLLPDGSVSIRCFRAGAAYRLVFPGLVEFSLVPSPPAAGRARGGTQPDGTRGTWDVRACVAGDTDLVTVRHLLLDQVIPRLIGHGGRLVVHAAAVELPCGRTVAFVGETGAGKSTVAAAFQGRGARVLTDDCLLLRQQEGAVQCLPAYTGLRLWPDSLQALLPADIETAPMAHYAGKRRVAGASRAEPAGTGAAQWRELSALFLLDSGGSDLQIATGEHVQLAPAGGRTAVMALIGSLFTLDVPDPQRAGAAFASAARLANGGLPIYRLDYTRDFACLPDVCRAVEAQFG